MSYMKNNTQFERLFLNSESIVKQTLFFQTKSEQKSFIWPFITIYNKLNKE